VAAVEQIVGLLVTSAAVRSVWGYGAARRARPRGPPSPRLYPGCIASPKGAAS
jgi:hypothetical protein